MIVYPIILSDFYGNAWQEMGTARWIIIDVARWRVPQAEMWGFEETTSDCLVYV